MAKTDKTWDEVQQLLSQIYGDKNQNLIKKSQRQLLDMLADALAEFTKSGKLEYNTELLPALDDVFDKFEKEKLRPITNAIAKQAVQTVEKITAYYKLAVVKKSFEAAAKKQEDLVWKKLGINRTKTRYSLVRGGYLDKAINVQGDRQSVQKK